MKDRDLATEITEGTEEKRILPFYLVFLGALCDLCGKNVF